MAILVEEQDVVIKNVHDAAVAVNTDMEQGYASDLHILPRPHY